MKFIRYMVMGWNRSRAAQLCTYSFVLSMFRFLYYRKVPSSLIFAWLDLIIIPIMGILLIIGWVLLCRQMVRFRTHKKRAHAASQTLYYWDEEIRALSMELCIVEARGAPTEEIEAINERLNEAHQRRAREVAILRKQS